MARATTGHMRPFTAGADFSPAGFVNRFVKMNGNAGVDKTPEVIRCSVAGERAVGVLVDRPTQNNVASVQVRDVARIEASGVIAVNDPIATDSVGRATKLTGATQKAFVNTSDAGAANDPVAGFYCLGYALTAAAAAGDLIEVELCQPTFIS